MTIFKVTITFSLEKKKIISDEYADAVKYLALDLPKAACKALLQSKTIKVHLKELLFEEMELEMQSVCSSKNNSLLRKRVMALNLKEFEDELRTKAPVTNDLFLDMLCTSSPQKKHKLSASSEVLETKAERATSVRLTVASMILYCRCPQLAALSTRIGLIVRDFGSGRMVSSFFY